MARFCTNCGNKIVENASFCVFCGSAVKNEYNTNIALKNVQTGYGNSYSNAYQNYCYTNNKYYKTGLTLGILGIVLAWLFALAGHVLSIIGIVIGVKEYKKTRQTAGLTLSIIGEACSLISSIIGIILSSSIFYYM